MGANLSKGLAKLFNNKEMRVLMLGLDAAGKTSKVDNETKEKKSLIPPLLHSDSLQTKTQSVGDDDPYSRVQC
jgi:hypothetical protein